MADNVGYTPGAGAEIGADEIAGVLYQRLKLIFGGDGVNQGDVSSANPLPVQDGASATALNAIIAKLVSLTEIPADDTDGVGLATRLLPQHVSRIGFSKAIAGNVDSEWGSIVGSIGTGMAVNQTGGNLVVTSGTTARSETIIRSSASWQGGVRLRSRVTLSQRIVNNNFFVELVDVVGDGLAYTISSATVVVVTMPSGHGFTTQNVGQSMYLGGFSGTGTFLSGRYPIASVSGDNVTFTVSGFAAGAGTLSAFGWNYYQLQYQGTTATNVNFDTQRKGYASGATNATISTTASPGHLAIVTANDLTATFADQLVASTGAIQQTVRATRVENVPDDTPLRLQIRIANGATAPASTTTLTIGLISISNFAAQDVSIQDVRPTSVVPLPVEILRSISLAISSLPALSAGTNAIGDVGTQYRANATGAATTFKFAAGATVNNALILTGARRLLGWQLTNTTASFRYFRFYNKATAPTSGEAPTFIVPIPPNSQVNFNMEGGISLPLGLGIACTAGITDTDATVTVANDVIGSIHYV
jgi:hypothetical protein